MELEFDKEMDALLRKARSDTGVPVRGQHLDADVIAAFAEGAIPDAARKSYTAHFADCDSCRKALSQVALLNEPAAMAAVAAAAPARSATQSPAASWYRSLFRTPGLAAAFGILVIALAGGLVYLVTQRSSNQNSGVAFDTRTANANSIPYAGIDTNSSANVATAAASNATATMSNASNSVARSNANAAGNSTTTFNKPASAPTGTSSDTVAAPSGGISPAQPPVAAAAPPTDLPINGRDTKEPALDKPKTAAEAGKNKDEDLRETTRSRALSDDSFARGDTVARKAAGGPLRNAGPVQNQVQSNVMNGEMPVTRRVGGKTFHNSNGAWYDNAYHGQSTTNVRRSSDDFKKLDSGLRSIANELGGVVVVVWKDKAYRIQ